MGYVASTEQKPGTVEGQEGLLGRNRQRVDAQVGDRGRRGSNRLRGVHQRQDPSAPGLIGQRPDVSHEPGREADRRHRHQARSIIHGVYQSIHRNGSTVR